MDRGIELSLNFIVILIIYYRFHEDLRTFLYFQRAQCAFGHLDYSFGLVFRFLD